MPWAGQRAYCTHIEQHATPDSPLSCCRRLAAGVIHIRSVQLALHVARPNMVVQCCQCARPGEGSTLRIPKENTGFWGDQPNEPSDPYPCTGSV